MKFTLDIEINEKDTDKCTKEDVYSEIVSFLRHCEVSSKVTLRSGDELPPMTVKEAIERKIIDSPFALKGAYSGKMYFFSWKNKIIDILPLINQVGFLPFSFTTLSQEALRQ